MEDQVTYRIDRMSGFWLMAASLLVDAVQGALNLLIVGGFLNSFIISPFAWLSFWWWFNQLGVRYSKTPGDFAAGAVSFVIEMIPFINTLPGWTAATAILIYRSRQQDAGKGGGVIGKIGAGALKNKLSQPKTVAGGKGTAPAVSKDSSATKADSGVKEKNNRTAKGKEAGDVLDPDEKIYGQRQKEGPNSPAGRGQTYGMNDAADNSSGKKEGERPEPGQTDEQKKEEAQAMSEGQSSSADEDTRSDWYKRMQEEQGMASEEAPLEDLAMGDNVAPDAYREPIEKKDLRETGSKPNT